MNGNVIYKRDKYIIAQNSNRKKQYYTVVDLETKRHCHFNNFKGAKLMIHYLIKDKLPSKCGRYFVMCYNRMVYGVEPWEKKHCSQERKCKNMGV